MGRFSGAGISVYFQVGMLIPNGLSLRKQVWTATGIELLLELRRPE